MIMAAPASPDSGGPRPRRQVQEFFDAQEALPATPESSAEQNPVEAMKREAALAQAEIAQLHERIASLEQQFSDVQVSAKTLEALNAIKQESQHILAQTQRSTQQLLEWIERSQVREREETPTPAEQAPDREPQAAEAEPALERAEPSEQKEALPDEITFDNAKQIFLKARERMKTASVSAEILKSTQKHLKAEEKKLAAVAGKETVGMDKRELLQFMAQKKAEAVAAIVDGIERIKGKEVADKMKDYVEDYEIDERLLFRDFDMQYLYFEQNLEAARKKSGIGGLEADLESAQEQAKLSGWKALITNIPFIGDSAAIRSQMNAEKAKFRDGLLALRDVLKKQKDAEFHHNSVTSDKKTIARLEEQMDDEARTKMELRSAETAYKEVEKNEKDIRAFLASNLSPRDYGAVKSGPLPPELPDGMNISEKVRTEYLKKYQMLAAAQEAFKLAMLDIAETINLPLKEKQKRDRKREEDAAAWRIEEPAAESETAAEPESEEAAPQPQAEAEPEPAPAAKAEAAAEPEAAPLDTERSNPEQPKPFEQFGEVKQYTLRNWDAYVNRAMQRVLRKASYGDAPPNPLELLKRRGDEESKKILDKLAQLRKLAESSDETAFHQIMNDREYVLQSAESMLLELVGRSPEDIKASKEDYWKDWDRDTLSAYKEEFGIDRLKKLSIDVARSQIHPKNRKFFDRILITMRRQMKNAETSEEISSILNQRYLLLADLKQKEQELRGESLDAKVDRAINASQPATEAEPPGETETRAAA